MRQEGKEGEWYDVQCPLGITRDGFLDLIRERNLFKNGEKSPIELKREIKRGERVVESVVSSKHRFRENEFFICYFED